MVLGREWRHIVLRTLSGTLRLESPRFRACPCAAAGPATVSPAAALLPERTTPELLLWEARYAALTSYGAAASLRSPSRRAAARSHCSAATMDRFAEHAAATAAEQPPIRRGAELVQVIAERAGQAGWDRDDTD